MIVAPRRIYFRQLACSEQFDVLYLKQRCGLAKLSFWCAMSELPEVFNVVNVLPGT
jgi:hypothetical protein